MPDMDSQPARPLIKPADFAPYRFTVRGTDADWQDNLQPAALFSFMQEAAYANAEALQMGSSRLDAQGLCWILIRVSVRFSHMPRWDETITIDTWSRGAQRLIFLRDFEFFDQQGRKFGSASSEWLVASQDAHRPQKHDDVFPGLQAPASSRSALQEPARRPPPLSESALEKPLRTFHAEYSDIDRNRHVNNTRYIAWCLDAVCAAAEPGYGPGVLPAMSIQGIDIHYINEVFYGSEIFCYVQQEDPGKSGVFLVEARSAADRSPIFRARVMIAGGSTGNP